MPFCLAIATSRIIVMVGACAQRHRVHRHEQSTCRATMIWTNCARSRTVAPGSSQCNKGNGGEENLPLPRRAHLFNLAVANIEEALAIPGTYTVTIMEQKQATYLSRSCCLSNPFTTMKPFRSYSLSSHIINSKR